ncbi:MAG: HYR domain-containing protein, partial [Blastocatellia bacterium]
MEKPTRSDKNRIAKVSAACVAILAALAIGGLARLENNVSARGSRHDSDARQVFIKILSSQSAKRGRVAILSTPAFDATSVDPSTITFDAPVITRKNGKVRTSIEDVNGDGLLDLVVQVALDKLEISSEPRKLILRASMVDGSLIQGGDCIQSGVPCSDEFSGIPETPVSVKPQVKPAAPTAAVIVSAGATIVSESCTPANGAIDPNEIVTISFCIQNVGDANTTNLVGTLQATGGVTVPSGPQNYGVVVAGGPPVCRNFTFTAAGTCGGTLTGSIQFQDGAANLGTVTFTFTLGTQAVAFSENFDGVTAPNLPAGWVSAFTNGAANCTPTGTCALGNNWTTVTSPADTAANSAFHNDPSCVTNNTLDTPGIPITTTTAVLTFRNNFNLETGFDGAVLEFAFSTDGGATFNAFNDIVAAGGSFGAGGYNGTISANFLSPIAGRQAWTGDSAGFITTSVNLPAVPGAVIKFRFRVASDCNNSGTGQNIDTIRITDGFTCTTCPLITCTITCPANITVSNDPNQCGAVVNYPAPTTTGNCGTITCSPASGSFFPVGTTTVTCTSTAGPNCTFTVTVLDTQPPVITCPANITTTTTVSCPIVTTSGPVNFTTTASDNCPGVVVVCNPPSGSVFPVGTTTVTCTATDASGNTATCSFTVSVFSGCLQDETKPNNVVLFNTVTGQYRFCCNGTVVATGFGVLTIRGCIGTIDDLKGNRKVHIEFDFSAPNGKGAGTAFLALDGSSTPRCQITDQDMTDN